MSVRATYSSSERLREFLPRDLQTAGLTELQTNCNAKKSISIDFKTIFAENTYQLFLHVSKLNKPASAEALAPETI